MENSKIQWTHHTMNPWHGCTRVSEGCTLCYAERQSRRNPAVLGEWGPNGTRVVASEAKWREPIKWNNEAREQKTRFRVFCASIADVFEDWNGDMLNAQRQALFANRWYPPLGRGAGDRLTMNHIRERLGDVIRRTPFLDWLLLTKRPENVLPMMADHMFGMNANGSHVIPPNVWVGGTVENQKRAEERCPELVKIRRAGCSVVFISGEPLLEGIRVDPWLDRDTGVNWVICGGESGAADKVRSLDPMWARILRDQCADKAVPFFMKQMGVQPLGLTVKGKGGEIDDIPEDLRVREFPL